jgi:hypothetical protein
VKAATPPVSGTGNELPLKVKVTEPVGVPVAGDSGVTVAVTVTGSVATDGSGETATVVVVAAWLTAGDAAAVLA